MVFEEITTQEQLDSIIKERLNKAKAQHAEELSAYKGVKEENEAQKQRIADVEAQLTSLTEQMQGKDAELTAQKEQIAGYEKAAMKSKIALEVGLPHELAARLTGDDEEAVRADAEKMKSLFVRNNTQPLADTEKDGKVTKRQDSMYQTIRNSRGE